MLKNLYSQTRMEWNGHRATLSTAGWYVRSAPHGLLTTCIQFYPQSFGWPVAFEDVHDRWTGLPARIRMFYLGLSTSARMFNHHFDGYVLAICHVQRILTESIASVENNSSFKFLKSDEWVVVYFCFVGINERTMGVLKVFPDKLLQF